MNSSDRKKADSLADILRSVGGIIKKHKTTAVIVAAGSSVRIGGEVPKQFLPLCGMPVVAMTWRAYDECECIDDIVLVVRAGDERIYEQYCKKFGFFKPYTVVGGGASRQESVLHGIEAAPSDSDYFAIADAARPLTTPEMIRSVCLAAYRYGAATAAAPATDTIKTADKKGFIASTVERTTAWQASTPQVFGANLYRAAAYTAQKEGFEATDDNSLVERIDHRVKLVDCGRENIKITTAMDITVAEAIISERRRMENDKKNDGGNASDKSSNGGTAK